MQGFTFPGDGCGEFPKAAWDSQPTEEDGGDCVWQRGGSAGWASFALQRAPAWGSAQPLAGLAAFFGVLGARLALAKSCLDTDVIEISLREAYLQTCPALEPAPPAPITLGCVAGVKSARNDGV